MSKRKCPNCAEYLKCIKELEDELEAAEAELANAYCDIRELELDLENARYDAMGEDL